MSEAGAIFCRTEIYGGRVLHARLTAMQWRSSAAAVQERSRSAAALGGASPPGNRALPRAERAALRIDPQRSCQEVVFGNKRIYCASTMPRPRWANRGLSRSTGVNATMLAAGCCRAEH